MQIREKVLISELVTMRLGGEARYVIEVESAEEVPEAYACTRKELTGLGDGGWREYDRI